MTNHWVVEPAHPKGRLVAMTPAEEAQHLRDQAAGRAAQKRQARKDRYSMSTHTLAWIILVIVAVQLALSLFGYARPRS